MNRLSSFLLAALAVFIHHSSAAPLKSERTVRLNQVRAEVATKFTEAEGLPSADVRWIEISEGVVAHTMMGSVRWDGSRWTPSEAIPPESAPNLGLLDETALELVGGKGAVRQVASGKDGALAVASESGLFLKSNGEWSKVYPGEGARSWSAADCRCAAFDSKGALWVGCPQGLGKLEAGKWTLYTGDDGLPYADFTCMAVSQDGSLWLGTRIGAIRFDGEVWEYRQGKRWLPGDEIRQIAIAEDGTAWFATDGGVGKIEKKPMSLYEKARFLEDEIDKYHRRTPFGYVLGVRLEKPGDKSKWHNSDSDNDGLWTSMYGAGECYAYAATGDSFHKERAKKAFEALRFLSVVTQGGEKPAPKGFPARSILPTSGWNPNAEHYTLEKDQREKEQGDSLWKVMHPRWPKSADGEWYWKCDTSSDELDGHYFFNAIYYDLAADTEEEKARVREVVLNTTDHLIEHDFTLVDWDGKPTRWAQFGPKQLNHDPMWWEERGLNSLSMLAYLAVAEHMSGAGKYAAAAKELVEKHSYAINLMVPKIHAGPGTGNHSDDEMAFMGFYNLIKYEKDPEVKALALGSFQRYWMLERPELNPLFNYMYAAVADGGTASPAFDGPSDVSPPQAAFEEAADSLVRFPADRFHWELRNSHRLDIKPITRGIRGRGRSGCRKVSGQVLPIDERFVGHWNHNPYTLDYGGNGMELADGAVYLLPYYMGLYYGYVAEE
ncbi:MAG: hypothetical protein GHCLOJNM_04349 [bacterium]|nr:hypothetical protein [bacterium]